MNRSTILLFVLLVVLGAIVYLVLPGDDDRMASYDATPVSFTVDSASVVRLSIERPGKSIVVENVGGRWTITSHGNLAADPARVMEVVGGLSRFRPGSLVSSNPAKQPVFQVDSSGSLVTLTERSGAKRQIIIGKMGPSFSEVYFRLPGESNVHLGSGITTWSLEREIRDWRDRTIFASPAESITGLTVTSAGKTRTFTRDSAGWSSGAGPVPVETINPLLTALSNVRAEDFIDSAVQFSGAPARVEVAGAVTTTLEFYRLAGDTARYAVRASSSPQVFVVGKYAAGQLLKPIGDARVAGLASVRKGAAAEQQASAADEPGPEDVATETAAAPPVTPPKTVTTQPARQESREPARQEAVPPAAEPAGRAETGKASEPPPQKPAAGGAVNPFKQKPAGERAAQAPAVGTPPAGTRTGEDQGRNVPARTESRPAQTPPATPAVKAQPPAAGGGADDEGELTVHVVRKGESMTTIAKQYGVSVEQILKWNLLKSISVRPGQELYIFVRK